MAVWREARKSDTLKSDIQVRPNKVEARPGVKGCEGVEVCEAAEV